ncbi:hypothetical protein FFLO_03116 [Filobasidium floriforme]|uniref:Snf7-domain-containing protein n=2 Tax=Filobasidium floriforme TaxID=5210 RepID=A0A8K0JLQ8_9TREE|nr:hypothetical protein FFLO_03116 [Filobasidium floriforme]
MAPPTSLAQLLEDSSTLQTPSQPRLQALYTFTSNQELTNPAGYEANLRWWSSVLEESLREGLLGRGSDSTTVDRLGFEVDKEALGRAFEWTAGGLTGTGRPKGLASVVDSQLSSTPPNYLPLPSFLSSPYPISQTPSLTSRLITAPLWWGLSKLNPFGASSSPKGVDEEKIWKRLRGVRVVHLGLVEEVAQNLISHLASSPPLTPSAHLLTTSSFLSRYSTMVLPSCSRSGSSKDQEQVGISERDCKILLRYLQRDKKVLVADEKGEVYKIVPLGTDPSDVKVTEADRGTVAIMATLDKLDRQIEGIHEEMISAQTKASTFLKQNQKTIALSYLRSKKQLESVLEKRVGAAEQLRTVLRGIDNAQGDAEIIKAYEMSTSTLRSVLSNPALQRDRVDATMDALADALADQQEIDQAIQSGGQLALAGSSAGVDVDEDDLEKELEGLVQEKKREEDIERQSDAKREEERIVERAREDREIEERLQRLRPAATAGETTSEEAIKGDHTRREVQEEAA